MGKTFTVEVKSSKKITRSPVQSSREATAGKGAESKRATTRLERKSPMLAATLQSLVHQFSNEVCAESGSSQEPRDFDRVLQDSTEPSRGRILPDLTVREPLSEDLDRHVLPKSKRRPAGALHARPAGAKPGRTQVAEEIPSRIKADPLKETVRAPGANAAPSMLTAEPERKSKKKRFARGAHRRSGESFPAGQRWKRRLPKVCR
jgi:hypothetical protein